MLDENRRSEDERHEAEANPPQPQKHEDPRRAGYAGRALLFHLMGAGLALYWLYGIIVNFVKGGPEAPSVGLLITAVAVLGGGAVGVAVMSLRTYRREKAAAQMTEEEAAQMEAPQAEDKDDRRDSEA